MPQTLSVQHAISVKIISKRFYIFLDNKIFKILCAFILCHSPSPSTPATFQGLHSHL